MNICLTATLQSIEATVERITLSARFEESDDIVEFSGRLIEITILQKKENKIVGRATSLMTDDCNVFVIEQKCIMNDYIIHLCNFVNFLEKENEASLVLEVSMDTSCEAIPKTSNQTSLNASYGVYSNVQWAIMAQ